MSDPFDWPFAWLRAQQEILRQGLEWSAGAAGNMPWPWWPPQMPRGGTDGAAPQPGVGPQRTGPVDPLVDVWQRRIMSFEWPALGLTRERQEAGQRLAQLAAKLGQAQMRLTAHWAQMLTEAVQGYGERIAARLAQGEAIGSLKALYELWIEAAEEAFARMAHGARYAQTQAELANATAALRAAQRELLESWSRELDLPTRTELNSVHRRLKDMKAELRMLEQGLAGEDVAAERAAPAPPGTPPASAGRRGNGAAGAPVTRRKRPVAARRKSAARAARSTRP